MPKKVPNQKAVAANERKAAHQLDIDRAKREEEEAREAAEWSKGGKGKSKLDVEKEKKALAAQKKAERDALLAAEEKSLKSAPPVAAKKISKGVARGSEKVALKKEEALREDESQFRSVEAFAASNLDDALELLDSSAGSVGSTKKNTAIERHPERRAKAAYAAFEERMLPEMKKENPGLRLSQLKELIWKLWQKSPENPFNQQHVAYDASRDEKAMAIEALRKQTEDRLRVSD